MFKIEKMKKTYINPEIVVVKIETTKMLLESKMDIGDPTNTMDAPEFDLFEE